MISIAIGDVKHNPDYAWLQLQGGTLLPGLLGAAYEPQASRGALVEERIALVFKGTPAQIASVLMRLEDQLARANRYTEEQVGCAHYLRLKFEDGGYYYYARILNARLEPKELSLAYYTGGSLGVDLIFTRPNHFDSEEIAVPIDNSSASDVTSGLTLYNHDDGTSGHDNFFYIDDADIVTELPAPLRLELTNNYASGALKDLMIGSFQYNAFNALPALVYEGESGSGGTDQADANSSNAYFCRLTWNTVVWEDLLYWPLTSANITKFQGRSVMPLMRLANAHSYSDLQLKLKVLAGGITLYEGASITADSSLGYLVFPALRLPPAPLSGAISAQAHALYLSGLKTTAGGYTLDIDYILLLPLDSFSHYQALINLAQNDRLIDDAFEGLVNGVGSGLELSTHIPLQQGHFIRPGHDAYFYVFQSDGADDAPIERTLSVKVFYRQRKRIV